MSVPFGRRAFNASLILSSLLMLAGILGLLWVHLEQPDVPPSSLLTAAVLTGAFVEIAAVWLFCRH